ncbi:MAG: hypothetical protein PHR91_00045 [Candidatus Omnitrophica bacterium]|nr:hypothetical protein [Candidatus Omnitrophota bacterium]
MRSIKSLVLIVLSAAFFLLGSAVALKAQEKYSSAPKLVIFYSPACNHCLKVRSEFMPRIEAKYNGVIEVKYLDLDNLDNYKYLLSLQEKYACPRKILPIIYMQGRFLDVEARDPAQIEYFIEGSLGRAPSMEGPFDEIDLIARFKSLPLLAVVIAGAIDGINPCAFTVIVFFIAFLMAQKYRRREVAAVGLSFILAVFASYFFLGLGLFRVLYAFKGFYLVKNIVYGASALICFVLFAFTLYDIRIFKKTGRAEEVTLRLPDKVRNLIHRVIGKYYRRAGEDADQSRGMLRLILSASACGFFVSMLEAVCTGQLYLPIIVFVLKSSSLKAQALFYLVIYNIMFTVPLLLIFLLALLGVSSGQFARSLRSHLVAVKVLLAAVFLGLGIALLAGI